MRLALCLDDKAFPQNLLIVGTPGLSVRRESGDGGPTAPLGYLWHVRIKQVSHVTAVHYEPSSLKYLLQPVPSYASA
ncbi:hypothetical protein FVEN_g13074 [Fusarium venenatum]|uniref:Uncharacterized protein n=1 Tax=Fusarium venenatum TaxID=56646 RepID=A0A2L2SMM7_9HYPO|nr:uncharacterized protein FVRRES_11175 [Fusarium venenatum]KAG8350137.1 hypothetical protein FVEN_g13074 [Fusarium venenatum]CEI38484.1 unnamed protein product [Fusarium venenatum]